jgi:hypothetical protein
VRAADGHEQAGRERDQADDDVAHGDPSRPKVLGRDTAMVKLRM